MTNVKHADGGALGLGEWQIVPIDGRVGDAGRCGTRRSLRVRREAALAWSSEQLAMSSF